MNTPIREIKPTESNFLADMLYEAIFVPEGQDPLPKDIIKEGSLSKYFEDWGKDQFDIALVVEMDNQLIGAIWGRLFNGHNKGYGYVDDATPELSMAILNDYRNQGMGTKLMQAIFTEYQKIGVNQLSLSVDKANKASNLYLRMGFEIVQETETSWTMKKSL